MDKTMRLNPTWFPSLLLTICLGSELNSFPQEKTADPFPMEEGTTWVYRGIVRWYDMQSQRTMTKTVTSRSEVIRVIRRNDLVAARVKGFPADFDWSEGESLARDQLFVKTSNDLLYIFPAEQVEEKLKRLQDPEVSLKGMLPVDDLLMSLAPRKGMKFCDAKSKARTDDLYCWAIASVREVTLNGVNGLEPASHPAYLLQFVTLPDDTELEFVPGVGFISYRYHHHGSIADTEMSLIEYHRSGNALPSSGVKR